MTLSTGSNSIACCFVLDYLPVHDRNDPEPRQLVAEPLVYQLVPPEDGVVLVEGTVDPSLQHVVLPLLLLQLLEPVDGLLAEDVVGPALLVRLQDPLVLLLGQPLEQLGVLLLAHGRQLVVLDDAALDEDGLLLGEVLPHDLRLGQLGLHPLEVDELHLHVGDAGGVALGQHRLELESFLDANGVVVLHQVSRPVVDERDLLLPVEEIPVVFQLSLGREVCQFNPFAFYALLDES